MKKTLSILLALSLLFSFPVAAFADEPKSISDPSITITVTGYEFDDYKGTITDITLEIKDGETVLTRDKDYEVDCENTDMVVNESGYSKVWYTVEGIGNYTGWYNSSASALAPTQGKAGDKSKWNFDTDARMLQISGEGKLTSARSGDFKTVYIEGVNCVDSYWYRVIGEEYDYDITGQNVILTSSVKTVMPDAFRIKDIKNVDIQQGVKTLKKHAISPISTKYKSIYVPKSVTKIEKEALGYRCEAKVYEEDKTYSYKKVKDFVIIGESGSAAQKYAKKNKFKFVTLSPANISKVKAGKKSLTASWKRASNSTGYEIQYSTSRFFIKAQTESAVINGSKTTSKKIKKLKKGKKYYVRLRSVKKVGKKKYYSCWSKTKSVKVK